MITTCSGCGRTKNVRLFPMRCSCGTTTYEDGGTVDGRRLMKRGRDGKMKRIVPLGTNLNRKTARG